MTVRLVLYTSQDEIMTFLGRSYVAREDLKKAMTWAVRRFKKGDIEYYSYCEKSTNIEAHMEKILAHYTEWTKVCNAMGFEEYEQEHVLKPVTSGYNFNKLKFNY